jgi:hypothetical protein
VTDEPRLVLAFVPDLMDRSRITAVAPAVEFVRSVADLVGRPADVVIVDLSRIVALEPLGSVAGRVIAFAPHVDRDRLGAARAHGVEVVLPRSEFFRRLAELLLEQ